LSSIVSELGTLTVATQAARDELEQRVAESREVRAVLRGQSVDTARLTALLDTLRGPNDVGMPVSVVARDGTIVYGTGALEWSAADPDSTPPLSDERQLGPFRRVDGEIVYWVTLPLLRNGEAEGWIAQRRALGDVQAVGITLGALLGNRTRILVGAEGDSIWVDLASGDLVSMAFDGVVVGQPYHFDDPAAGDVLAVAGPLPELSRLVQADMPMTEVLARPHAFRRNALVLAASLTALAVLIGWVSSGRLTEPLQSLVTAADAMAAGNYRSRVTPTSDDEVGHLGRAFNAMADRVASSDEALRAKLEEVQALAVRLEQANVEAERARAEAQESSRVKSEFLAVMSHEIRTPINVVISYVELLKAGVPDEPTEKQRNYLQRIDQSSRLLVWLLNDLLDFSSIESGQMQVEMGVGSGRTAVDTARSALEAFAEGKGITLTGRCEADPRFHADEQRVQQIVLNLVSNAIKFTPRGGTVSVTCTEAPACPPGMDEKDDAWVRIDVLDTGVGIPQDQIATMFEPFVRGDSEQTGGASGAGLGLAISRRLAEMMSGTITVESTLGQGTKFTLWLRAASWSARAPAPGGQVLSPLGGTAQTRSRTRSDESELSSPRI
jgi:signal transduction histidine kinase